MSSSPCSVSSPPTAGISHLTLDAYKQNAIHWEAIACLAASSAIYAERAMSAARDYQVVSRSTNQGFQGIYDFLTLAVQSAKLAIEGLAKFGESKNPEQSANEIEKAGKVALSAAHDAEGAMQDAFEEVPDEITPLIEEHSIALAHRNKAVNGGASVEEIKRARTEVAFKISPSPD